MDEETLRSVMTKVGNENAYASHNESKSSDTDRKIALRKYRSWWYGLMISFIPLFAIPVDNIVSGNVSSFGGFLYMLFSSCEILFIGVSLVITASNDFQTDRPKNERSWMADLSMGLILIGTLIYGIIAVSHNTSEAINNCVVLGFNIFFLVSVIVLATAEYLSK